MDRRTVPKLTGFFNRLKYYQPDHEPCRKISHRKLKPKPDPEPLHFGVDSFVPVAKVLAQKKCPICALVASLVLTNPGYCEAWKTRYLQIYGLNDGSVWYVQLLGLNASQSVSSTTIFWNSFVRSGLQDLGSLQRQDGRGNLAPWIKDEQRPGQTGRQMGPVMAQIWLRGCIQSHPGCGQSSFASQPSKALDLLLIDVVDARLVQGTSVENYVALSYVSGGTQTTRTLRSNFELLCQAGSIGGSSFPLPSLFVDTISLVRMLGMRYLWIDALCIIQDDVVKKHSQIMQMDAVYHQAYLTVVALSSRSAESRLPQINDDASAVHAPIAVIGSDHNLLRVPPSLRTLLKSSMYEERGWTLQERLLSKRCLYLTDLQACFTCSSSIEPQYQDILWNDSDLVGRLALDSTTEDDRLPWSQDIDHDGRWSWEEGFVNYVSLLKVYTCRELSYESDIVNAFTGLITMLSHRCGGCFFFGLPERVFDIALLWFINGDSYERRNINQPELNFPSWSWAGWRGVASYFESDRALYLADESLDILRFRFHPEVPTFHLSNVDTAKEWHFIERSTTFDHPDKQQWIEPSKDSRTTQKAIPILFFQSYSASTITLTLLRETNVLKHGLHLVDSTGYSCGTILGWPLEGFVHRPEMELVLLHRILSEPTHNVQDGLVSLTGRKPSFRTSFSPYKNRVTRPTKGGWSWGLLCLMLIEWKGDVAERVGIVLMYEKDYLKLEPEVKHIRLV